MANDLTINQLGTTLNAIVKQATGATPMAVTNTASFMSVANTALLAGYDNLIGAISQVLARSIFSIRPYTRKFKGLYASQQRWGNQVRKFQICDKDWSATDERYNLNDGDAVDMYKVNKPNLLQTNFYGFNAFERNYTVFKDQLDVAFTTPDEFQRFLTMVVTNCSDMIEQAHENLARSVIQNFIAGKIAGDATNVKHVLTDYNTETGQNLTATTVYAPDNFRPFIQWLSAYINTLSDLMEERSLKFHMNITGKPVSRHTPKRMQKVYMMAKIMNQIKSMALSDTYNPDFVRYTDNEPVNFWQSIESPASINVTPVYLDTTSGNVKVAAKAVSQDVLGVIFDEDAMGITTASTWSAPTPFNASGGYSNIFFHFTDRFWNDFTENGIVLLLD